MTHNNSAAQSLIIKVLGETEAEHADFYCQMLQSGLQDLVEAEAAAAFGAIKYEPTEERSTRRNDTRTKNLAIR